MEGLMTQKDGLIRQIESHITIITETETYPITKNLIAIINISRSPILAKYPKK